MAVQTDYQRREPKKADEVNSAVERRLPFSQFQYIQVIFGSADVDVAILHSLNVDDPETVFWEVVQLELPVGGGEAPTVYREGAASRKPWTRGVIYLRSNVPNLKCMLRLSTKPTNVIASTVNASGTTTIPTKAKVELQGSGATLVTVLSGVASGPSVAGEMIPTQVNGFATAGAGDSVYGVQISANITRASSGTHGAIYTCDIQSPTIGGTATTTNMAALHLGVPGDGTNNYSMITDGPCLINGRDAATQARGTWNPTFNNFTVGNGTASGRYLRVGNMVHLFFVVTFGSTSTFSASSWSLGSLPFAPRSGFNYFGTGRALEVGVNNYTIMPVVSGSTVSFIIVTGTGAGGGLTSTSPFTWNGTDLDAFDFTVWYETDAA